MALCCSFHQPSGRRWFRAFHLPTPFFPFGEGFTHPPTPSPGPGGGVLRAVRPPKMAQDGSKRASERSRLKMASKIAQDLKIARHADMAQLTHNMRPRGPSTAPRGYGATGLQLGDSRGDEELPGGPGEDGGWGEILSADRVNVSRKLGGERELSSNLERFLRDALACIWLERGGRGIP